MMDIHSALEEVAAPDRLRHSVNHLYDDIFVSEIYHHPAFRLADRSVILDIGANVGLYSLWARERYKPQAIYCYEPSPTTFSCLEANLGKFAGDSGASVYLRNLAITDQRGLHLKLHQSREISSTSTLLDSQIVPWIREASQSAQLDSFDIVTTTVSEEIHRHGLSHIDILKIDVEGCFREVLRGIDGTDIHRISNVVLEADYLPELGLSVGDVEQMLTRLGFMTTCCDRDRSNNVILFGHRV